MNVATESPSFLHPQGIDPDPFTAILIYLGAIGSIASIVSWYETSRDQRIEYADMQQDFDASLSRLRRISEIESDLARLEGLLVKLEHFVLIGTAQRTPGGAVGPAIDLDSKPARFGSVRLILTTQDLMGFAKLQREMHTIGGRVAMSVAKLIAELDRERYFVKSDEMDALQKFRDAMNMALTCKNFREALSRAGTVVDSGRFAMQQMTRAVGSPRPT